jgi:hypothetical protein
MNPKGRKIARFDAHACDFDELKGQPKTIARKLRLGLLVHGVDTNERIGGFLSATHGPDEVAHTADAFRAAIGMLRQEAELA